MRKHKGYEIYAVNTNGEWFTVIMKDGKTVCSDWMGLRKREVVFTFGQGLVNNVIAGEAKFDENRRAVSI